jgi:hypothetical protein
MAMLPDNKSAAAALNHNRHSRDQLSIVPVISVSNRRQGVRREMTMNLGSTVLVSAAHAAELPGDIVAWFLMLAGDSIDLLADDSHPDSWLGILTSCLAGVATALAATVIAMADSQVELRTDRNQTLAELQGTGLADEDGRSVLKGSVRLDYRTTDRVVVLNLPGQAQCEFRLRLAANPTRSDQFGPWHLADRVASPQGREATRSQQNDAFAIRYRVL